MDDLVAGALALLAAGAIFLGLGAEAQASGEAAARADAVAAVVTDPASVPRDTAPAQVLHSIVPNLDPAGAPGVIPGTAWPPAPSKVPPVPFDHESGADSDALFAGRVVAGLWGLTNIGCYSRGGHIRGSDHYTGNAIDVMLVPLTTANNRLGWTIADYVVVHAAELNVKYVIWDARKWTPGRGWRPYRHPSGRTDASHAHRDHVHVSFH